MTPPKIETLTWSVVAKLSFGIIGTLSMIILGWNAYEIRTMREVVYNGQSRTAVLESEVIGIKRTQEEMKAELRNLNARFLRDK